MADNKQYDCQVVPATCSRKPEMGMVNATKCDTSSPTVCDAANQCANQATVTDGKSCSKCASSCGTLATNETCVAAANCWWGTPICAPKTMTPTPMACSGTSAATCTAEMGCFWVGISDSQCGVNRNTAGWGVCGLCNGTMFTLGARSGLKNHVGKTCKWAVVAPYTVAYSLSINSASQHASCSGLVGNDAVGDPMQVTTFAKSVAQWTPFDTTTAPAITCVTQAAGVSSLMPSLALLGLIVAAIA